MPAGVASFAIVWVPSVAACWPFGEIKRGRLPLARKTGQPCDHIIVTVGGALLGPSCDIGRESAGRGDVQAGALRLLMPKAGWRSAIHLQAVMSRKASPQGPCSARRRWPRGG